MGPIFFPKLWTNNKKMSKRRTRKRQTKSARTYRAARIVPTPDGSQIIIGTITAGVTRDNSVAHIKSTDPERAPLLIDVNRIFETFRQKGVLIENNIIVDPRLHNVLITYLLQKGYNT